MPWLAPQVEVTARGEIWDMEGDEAALKKSVSRYTDKRRVSVSVYVSRSVRLSATPWTVARQVPLSMGFSRQEYWSGLPCPPPGDLPNSGIEPLSLTLPVLAGSGSLPLVPPGKQGAANAAGIPHPLSACRQTSFSSDPFLQGLPSVRGSS